MGYKSSTWVALLRPIMNDSQASQFLTLRTNCNVTHLKATGANVDQVVYRDPNGDEVTVQGDLVVVACSAIESVRLLMISCEHDPMNFGQRFKYGQSNGLLGRYFLTHCFGGAEVAILNNRFDKSLSLDSDYYGLHGTCDWLKSNQLWAGAAIYNNTSDCLAYRWRVHMEAVT